MKTAVRSSYILTLVWTFLFAAVFFPSLNDPFLTTYGDGEAVAENAGIRTLNAMSERPLTTLFYSAEFRFFKFHAPAYRATHLLLHWLNTLLVFLLLKRLGLATLMASLVTLALDIHPMRAESAIWIAQLDNILSSFFCLVSLLSYQQGQIKRQWGWPAASFVAFIAACLSDAAFSVGLPFVLMAMDARNPDVKPKLISKIPFFAVSLAIAAYALFVAGAPNWRVLGENIFLTGYAVAYHAAMFFMPLILSSFHPRPEIQGLVIVLAAVTLFSCAYLWKTRRSHPNLFFGAVFYVALFAPKVIAQVWNSPAVFFSDHDSYLPVVGLAFMAAQGMKNKAMADAARRNLWVAVYMVWVFWLSWLSVTRTDTFKSDISVWTDALKHYPYAETPLLGRGRAHLLAKNYDDAAVDLKKALQVNPRNSLIYFNLGEALLKGGKIEEGEQVLRDMQKLEPDNSESWSRLGDSALERKDSAEANSCFEKALSINPNDWRAYSGLGALAAEARDFKAALILSDKAAAQHPSSPVPYARRFALFTVLGQKEDGVRSFREAAKWEADTHALLALFKKEFERAGSRFDYE